MKYDKMVEITQEESKRKILLAHETIADMLTGMEKITVAELVKRTGLSRGFFYKNKTIRSEMDEAMYQQKSLPQFIPDKSKDTESDIDLREELLAEKRKNNKLAEENQELRNHNARLQQELEKLQRKVDRKEISILKNL